MFELPRERVLAEAVTTTRPFCARKTFGITSNKARLAQSAERKALDLVVVSWSPTVGVPSIKCDMLVRMAKMWRKTCMGRQKRTHWDLNPGPSACEADEIPLQHVPEAHL